MRLPLVVGKRGLLAFGLCLLLSCAREAPSSTKPEAAVDAEAPLPIYPPTTDGRLDACDGPALRRRRFTENRNGVRDPILFVSDSAWIGPPCREGTEPVLHLRDYRADRDDERDGMLCEYQTDEVPFGGRVPVDLGRDVIFSDGSTLGTATPAIVNDRPLRVIAGSTRGFARLLLDDSGHTWCFPGDGKPAIPISDVPVGRDAVHFGNTVAPRGNGRWSFATCDHDGVTLSPIETELGTPIAVAEDSREFVADRGAGPELFAEGESAPLPLPPGYVPLRFVLGDVVARRPDGGETIVPSRWPRSDEWVVDAPVGVRIADEVVANTYGSYAVTFQNTGACPFLAE
jgi:hypothetical protein